MSLLSALQLADSFFPTGMYTQSHGLERLVEAGLRGEAALEPVLRSFLHLAAAGDALAARWTVRAALVGDLDLLRQVDQRLDATKLASETRLASRRCGGRMLLLGVDVFGGELLTEYAQAVKQGQTPGHQAIALALMSYAAELDEETAVEVELHSFVTSLLSAAIRLGALDHIAAQRLRVRAQPWLVEAAAEGRDLDWRCLGGFAPSIEVAQFQHAGALMHLFVS